MTDRQGGYFTCHGPEAAKIGREFYATDTVVRHECEGLLGGGKIGRRPPA